MKTPIADATSILAIIAFACTLILGLILLGPGNIPTQSAGLILIEISAFGILVATAHLKRW